MRQLTLLAIPDCPLSAHARGVLDALAADRLLAWGEVSTGTPNGEALQRNAPELLPALFNESGLLLRTAGSPSGGCAGRSQPQPSRRRDRRDLTPAAPGPPARTVERSSERQH